MRDIFSVFFNMKVFWLCSLELPRRGDSNEYTEYSFFQYNKENQHKLSDICSNGIFSKALKNEFETAVVNEPLMFEPLKVYCLCIRRFDAQD